MGSGDKKRSCMRGGQQTEAGGGGSLDVGTHQDGNRKTGNGKNMKTENRKNGRRKKSKAKFVMERRSKEGQMSGVGISRTLGERVRLWGRVIWPLGIVRSR